jgi:transposase
MVRFTLDAFQRAKAVRYLLLGWRPDAIASEIRCHLVTVYRMERNLYIWGSATKPRIRTIGQPRKLTPADEEALFSYLTRYPTAFLMEMAWFIWEERDI